MRDIFNSAARLLVDGTRCPGRSSPARMARLNHSYSWRYSGILRLESRAIGGRKLAEMRFMRLKVAISYQIRVAIVVSHQSG